MATGEGTTLTNHPNVVPVDDRRLPDDAPHTWNGAKRRRNATSGAGPASARLGNQPNRAGLRYGVAIALTVAAVLAAAQIQDSTGHLLLFPFYAAVVISAWIGVGPGIAALVLSALAAADFWTPPRFDLEIDPQEVPGFITFVICALMSLVWSFERRRVHHALEAKVEQRTADLVRANAALESEMAVREAAEQERERTGRALHEVEAELARTLRLATMAELAATIAHEVNQPLAAITANGAACQRSLARTPPLLETAREAAACIVADGHRAGDVIAKIRALFNKEQPSRQRLDVNDVIRRTVQLSGDALDRLGVVVRTELAAPPPTVLADPVQIQQALMNLVSNAVDAMSDMAGRPRVLTVQSAVDGAAVRVTVEDTGSGLDPEQVTHIFDNFYTTKPGGIGVGLAISRSIIEMHGGSIAAAPADGGGARFGFTLPLPPTDIG